VVRDVSFWTSDQMVIEIYHEPATSRLDFPIYSQ
jgi:hypothetical protein